MKRRQYPGIPWRSSSWDSMLSLLRVWVQSLVGELGSHKQHGVAKKKKKKRRRQYPRTQAEHDPAGSRLSWGPWRLAGPPAPALAWPALFVSNSAFSPQDARGTDGVQGRQPLWHMDYFELKIIKAKNDSGRPFHLLLNCLKEFRQKAWSRKRALNRENCRGWAGSGKLGRWVGSHCLCAAW